MVQNFPKLNPSVGQPDGVCPLNADGVIADGRQLDAEAGAFGAEKRVGNLRQDACAVAGQRIGADRAAMIQIDQDLQPLADDFMTFSIFDIDDEANAARIMFVPGII